MNSNEMRQRASRMREMAKFSNKNNQSQANFEGNNPYAQAAGYGALGLGGAAALRYGVPEARQRFRNRNLGSQDMIDPRGGARGAAEADVQRVRQAFGQDSAVRNPRRTASAVGRNAADSFANLRQGAVNNVADAGRAVDSARAGVVRDVLSVGDSFQQGIAPNQLNTTARGGLKRGTRLGAGLNSGRKFLFGTNTGRAGLALGALGAGYAAGNALRNRGQ